MRWEAPLPHTKHIKASDCGSLKKINHTWSFAAGLGLPTLVCFERSKLRRLTRRFSPPLIIIIDVVLWVSINGGNQGYSIHLGSLIHSAANHHQASFFLHLILLIFHVLKHLNYTRLHAIVASCLNAAIPFRISYCTCMIALSLHLDASVGTYLLLAFPLNSASFAQLSQTLF